MPKDVKKYRIQFTRPYIVKDAAGRAYQPGDIEEVSYDSMLHFVRRSAAVRVTDGTKATGSTGTNKPAPSAVLGEDVHGGSIDPVAVAPKGAAVPPEE